MKIAVLLVFILSACAANRKVVCYPPPLPECRDSVDEALAGRSEAQAIDLLECIELLRHGYTHFEEQ